MMTRTSQRTLTTVLGLSVLALLVTIAHVQIVPLRVVIGLPFILFVPGWALLRAVHPDGDVARFDALLMMFGLSIAATICCGVVLDALRPGLQPVSWAFGMSVVSLLLELTAQLRATPEVITREGRRRSTGRRVTVKVTALVTTAVTVTAIVVGILFASAVHVADTQVYGPFTQLSMLRAPGTASGYVVGVQSHQHARETLSLVVTAPRQVIDRVNAITLAPGGSFSTRFTAPSDPLPLRATLYSRGRQFRYVVYQQRCPAADAPLSICSTAQAAAATRAATATRRAAHAAGSRR
jgi:uncharacterized membrane protein